MTGADSDPFVNPPRSSSSSSVPAGGPQGGGAPPPPISAPPAPPAADGSLGPPPGQKSAQKAGANGATSQKSWKRGDAIWVYSMEDRDEQNEERACFFAALDHNHGNFRPRVGMSEGWAPATISEDFVAAGAKNGGDGMVHFKYEWRHWFNCRGVYAKANELHHFVQPRFVVAREVGPVTGRRGCWSCLRRGGGNNYSAEGRREQLQ